jgi:hypothetical protein
LKILRRILFYTTLTFSVLLIALITSVFLFKDRIINQFIREANKNFNTPINIGKIDVSVFDQFPQISIVLTDVYIEDSHPGQYPLLTAKKISFQMNPVAVWKGNYTIKGLTITDSETNLKINDRGMNNYTVMKETKYASGGTISFELNDVDLKNTTLHYVDIHSQQDFIFTSKNLNASIESADNIYTIATKGHISINKLHINRDSYLESKSFIINSKIVFNDLQKHLLIKPSTLELKNAAFTVSGTYDWKQKNIIDLVTKGKNTDIQTLLSLLPETASKNLAKYKSEGEVYFNAQLKGEISKKKNPSISIDFGFTEATLFHPEYRTKIKEASLQGSFASGNLMDLKQASLILKNVNGKLNEENFTATLIIHNFSDPEVICNFKGKVDAPAVLSFYPIDLLDRVSGSLLVDISVEGKVGLLKNKATAQRVSTQGSIDLQDINFLYGKEKTPIEHLKGSLQFSNNDLALSNVSGKLGNSDFLLNGFFKNIITFLFFENQPIGIETDLQSSYLDLDQLFALGFGGKTTESNEEEKYTFSISPHIYLNFNCDVKSLRYERFTAQQLKGDLLVKNEMAVSRKLSFKSMGGDLALSGIVDAKNHKAIDVISTIRLNGIHLDSAFYVFKNFSQNFIENRHLKGQAFADLNLEMTFNQNLKLFQETLLADISIAIKKGELNNFEPMKKLSKYLDDEGLNKLRFSDLKNDIHIENKTIYIPQMEVHSNVTDIKISGTHTFDQHIDYRLITPLRKRKIIDVDAESAIEDQEGQPKLFLKITGTTDQYKISYDTESVKKKIVSDFKKEVQELKETFKNKGKKKQKEVELEKDEYFDWEQ